MEEIQFLQTGEVDFYNLHQHGTVTDDITVNDCENNGIGDASKVLHIMVMPNLEEQLQYYDNIVSDLEVTCQTEQEFVGPETKKYCSRDQRENLSEPAIATSSKDKQENFSTRDQPQILSESSKVTIPRIHDQSLESATATTFTEQVPNKISQKRKCCAQFCMSQSNSFYTFPCINKNGNYEEVNIKSFSISLKKYNKTAQPPIQSEFT
ncbi:Nodulin-25 [Frankliniella fusca]|uniref:Nodulin-25 n=1 Tax=Frankliniella fusca TaxID=407009 RepID=A0AAE1HP88_9NEOP|nr:Nodulin-25 [Frankliniella fusca]